MSPVSAKQDNSRLDDYRIVAELARGGMAAVFLGVYEGTARPREIVAIKVVHPHLAYDPDFVAMLSDEARIASSIGHPNVVEIREFVLGRADGRNYIVMEYADGETLSMFLKQASRGKRVGPRASRRASRPTSPGVCTPPTNSEARTASRSTLCTATSPRRTSSSPTTVG
nr:protein kinase [Deltaproteobacteria bacterium]